jgi:hypothetical protein
MRFAVEHSSDFVERFADVTTGLDQERSTACCTQPAPTMASIAFARRWAGFLVMS